MKLFILRIFSRRHLKYPLRIRRQTILKMLYKYNFYEKNGPFEPKKSKKNHLKKGHSKIFLVHKKVHSKKDQIKTEI